MDKIKAAVDKVTDKVDDMTTEEPIYIDMDTGVDDAAADGSESKPFKSLAYAYIRSHPQSKSKTYLTRKSETGPVTDGSDGKERLEWKPPAKSAVKKAEN